MGSVYQPRIPLYDKHNGRYIKVSVIYHYIATQEQRWAQCINHGFPSMTNIIDDISKYVLLQSQKWLNLNDGTINSPRFSVKPVCVSIKQPYHDIIKIQNNAILLVFSTIHIRPYSFVWKGCVSLNFLGHAKEGFKVKCPNIGSKIDGHSIFYVTCLSSYNRSCATDRKKKPSLKLSWGIWMYTFSNIYWMLMCVNLAAGCLLLQISINPSLQAIMGNVNV